MLCTVPLVAVSVMNPVAGGSPAEVQLASMIDRSPALSTFAACDPDGDVQFVCGPENPEDLALVPASPWVIVSSWQSVGYLSAANVQTRETIRIHPDESPQVRHDADLYGECPGALAERFHAHGLSLRPGSNGVHTLYVVRHNAREAIEIFEVDVRESRPILTWIGCVLGPEGAGLGFNSVVSLPHGGFATTSPATDDAWEWHPEAGWSQVPGSTGGSPNGIEVSEDGRWLYLGAHGAGELIRLSRGRADVQRTTLPVGFRIDNVHRAPDGSILVAGHDAAGAQVGACLARLDCAGIVGKVMKVAPDLSASAEIFSYASNDLLPLVTAAIQVSDEIWVGGLRGDRIAVIPAP